MRAVEKTEQIQDAYNEWAKIYDDQLNSLVALQDSHLLSFIGDVNELRICDAGCGTGRNALVLAERGAKVEGCDFSPGMLERARVNTINHPSIQLKQSDLNQRLPFDDNSFDKVLCALALEHISDLVKVFSEFNRICKPDGCIIISALHPDAFVPPTIRTGGADIIIKAYNHSVHDYHVAACTSGLTCVEEISYSVNADFVQKVPRACRYLNKNLLLLLKFKKR